MCVTAHEGVCVHVHVCILVYTDKHIVWTEGDSGQEAGTHSKSCESSGSLLSWVLGLPRPLWSTELESEHLQKAMAMSGSLL